MAEKIIKQQTRKFVDFDMNFTPHPNTGDISVVKNEEAVKQAVKNLVLTQLYERPFNPFKGSRVGGLLFENFNPALEDTIEDNINDLIQQYEPRAEFLGVDINYTPTEHSLNVRIYFRVVNIGIDTNVDVILAS